MTVINILFQFDNSTHIANVYYTASTGRFTIYFTDVELILQFGSKAEYSRQEGVKLLKPGKHSEDLVAAIARELEVFAPAA